MRRFDIVLGYNEPPNAIVMTSANPKKIMSMKTSNILVIALLIFGIVLGFILGKPFNPSKSETLTTLFSYPDGITCQQPCILGIQPGFTTSNQAVELLKTHPLTKGNTIRQDQFSGQGSVIVALEKNLLVVRVDYDLNQVLEVELISDGINGLGFVGINIYGKALNWGDMLSYLGSPEVITVSGGDGGIFNMASGLYDEGWCIHAEPSNSWDYPPIILSESRIIRIEINCHLLKHIDDLK